LTKQAAFVKLREKENSMTPPTFYRIPFLKCSLLLTFVVFFVGSIPFAHALEIHHLFAEIDHDAHQHSEFDLCQWVKKHTSNTLVWDLPRVSHGSIGILFFFPENSLIYDSLSGFLSYSRGPPRG
jgi:hypothetical protein